MSRTTLVSAVAGLLLVGGLAAPALAQDEQGREGGCVRLDPESGEREGFCVYVPITIPIGG